VLQFTLAAAKANFFDRRAVKDAIDRETRAALSRFGAYVRTRARTSIRKRKGTSLPGQPPFSHVGTLRNGILFAFDRERASVVIGPFPFRPGSPGPRLLEYGGFGVVVERGGVRRRAYWRPRPYMRPAFQAELARLPDHWKARLGARV